MTQQCTTQCHGQVATTSASQCAGPGFKSYVTNGQTWLSELFLVPQGKFQVRYNMNLTLGLKYSKSSIHHSLVHHFLPHPSTIHLSWSIKIWHPSSHNCYLLTLHASLFCNPDRNDGKRFQCNSFNIPSKSSSTSPVIGCYIILETETVIK